MLISMILYDGEVDADESSDNFIDADVNNQELFLITQATKSISK